MQDRRGGMRDPDRILALSAARDEHGSHVDRHDNDRGGDHERPPARPDLIQQNRGYQD